MGINKQNILPVTLLVFFFIFIFSPIGESKEETTKLTNKTLSKENNEWVVEFKGQQRPPNYTPNKKTISPASKQHKIVIKKSIQNFSNIVNKIPYKKIITYPHQVILIVDTKTLDTLDPKIKSNIKIRDDLNRIMIRGYNFDTTLTPPKIPDNLRLKENNKKQLYIIQFAGPILDSWRSKIIQDKKLQIVTHLKNNSILVFTGKADLNRTIKDDVLKNVIQWVGPYHPAYRISPEATKVMGDKVRVTVQVLPHNNIKESLSKLKKLSNNIFNIWKTKRYVNITLQIPSSAIRKIVHFDDVIYIEPYNDPKRGGGRQANIMADMRTGDTLPEPRPAIPANDYLNWITAKLTPSGQASPAPFGFIVDIADGGIDRGNTNIGSLHSSFHDASGLSSRLSYTQRIERTGPGTFDFNNTTAAINQDDDGHGTLMASVLAGYPTDMSATDNYRHGLGLAPYALIGSTKIFEMTGNATSGWASNFLLSPTSIDSEVGEGTTELYRRAYLANARIAVNSWGDTSSPAVYTVASQMIDEAVRDANPATNSTVNDLDEMLIIFLSGNSTDAMSGVNPNELWGWGSVAKNTIVVGGSESYKQDTSNPDGCGTSNGSANSIQDIYPQSTWGPVTGSNRKKPDLLAPATRIYGAATQVSTYADPDASGPLQGSRNPSLVCEEYYPTGQSMFTRANGTSFAAPAVAGAAANLRQWLTTVKNRDIPSPALLKAWLMNSTDYLSGVRLCEGCAILPDPDALPSSRQGMGLLNINTTLDNSVRFYQDQNTLSPFTSVGNSYIINGTIQDTSAPFRATLAWTDESGDPIDGGAIVNDLNLQVSITDTSTSTTSYYVGNDFDNDIATVSVTRDQSISYANSSLGNVDSENNVESIWIPASAFASGGPYTFQVTVTAASLNGDAVPYNIDTSDQDFALITYNAYVSANIDLDLNNSSTATGNNYLTSFTEGAGAVAIADSDVQITNVSVTPSSQPITTATISISSPSSGEILNYTGSEPNISASASATSITLTGSVTATIANFEAAISQITYNNTSATPTTGNRIINVTLNDSIGNSNTATSTVNVTATNNIPTATDDGTLATPLTVAESIAESITGFVIAVLSNDNDADGTLDIASINITSTPAFGSASPNPDGTISYLAIPDFVGTDQFTYTVNDNNSATSNTATVYINVTPSNDSPTISAPTGTLFQLQNSTMSFAPANTISINDVDVDGITGSFNVTISSPAPGNGTFNAPAATAGNGTNSISFSGNLNTVNTALIALSYTGNSGISGTETITINVNDNGNSGAADESETALTTFDITLTANAPPMLELDSDDDNRPPANDIDFENTFNLGTGNPIEIAEGTTINDVDSISPVSVTATLTNPLNGSDEALTISGVTSGVTGDIAFSYSGATLSLSPNGGASPTNADYAAAIDLIRYDNNAVTPDTTNRIITITVNDGISTNSATSTIDFQRRPVDIALVLDTSGSMQQLVDGTQRIQLLKDAVQLFLETWDGFDIPEDRLGTIYFNTGISTFPAPLAMEPFASNWSLHNTDIDSQPPAGWTSFGAGLQTAIEGLLAAPDGGLNRKPVVITFTDGQQNGSPMVMRPGSNYAPGNPVPPLVATTPYQILDSTVGDMVDDGFSVRTLSGLTQATTPISLSSADIPMNIHTIGTGVSGSNLETMLSKLSADTGGENFFATPDSFLSIGGIPSPLQDHFMTTLVNSLSETSLEMVGRVFSQLDKNSKIKSHRFTLNNATQRASFVLSWNKNMNMDELAFGLKTPEGNFIPVGTSGIDIRSNDYYFIVHLEFPLISRFGSIQAGGEWEMILQRKDSPLSVTHNLITVTQPSLQSVDYSVWVLEDESDVKDKIKIDRRRYKVGEPILLTAKVTDVARVTKKLLVTAQVSTPKIGLGSYLARNYKLNKKAASTRNKNTTTLDSPQTLYDKNLSLLLNAKTLPRELIPSRSSIRLNDNGENGDKLANDGIFSAFYTETKVPGSYVFDISIRGNLPLNGNISRQSRFTIVTEFDRFDIDNSTIRYSDIDPRGEIKNANKKIFITPVDKFGNLLGPGKSQLIRINIKNAKLIGQLQDQGNGNYVQYLLTERFLDPVIRIDLPGAKGIPVNSENKLTLIEWILIIIFAIALVLILYWLLKYLLMLLRK